MIMRASFVATVGALAAMFATPALADEQRGPTREQLLQRPPASEIVSRWVATCVDHAGDAAAQARVARASGLTWPYQFVQRPDPELGEVCGLVSTVAAGDDTSALQQAVLAALSPRHVTEVSEGGGYIGGHVTVSGHRYRILGNIDQQPGEALPTAVIILSSRQGSAP